MGGGGEEIFRLTVDPTTQEIIETTGNYEVVLHNPLSTINVVENTGSMNEVYPYAIHFNTLSYKNRKDLIELITDKDFSIESEDDFTLEAWMQNLSWTGTANGVVYFCLSNDGSIEYPYSNATGSGRSSKSLLASSYPYDNRTHLAIGSTVIQLYTKIPASTNNFHVAFVRKDNYAKLFINGVNYSGDAGKSLSSYTDLLKKILIGHNASSAIDRTSHGILNMRLIKQALWWEDFTPPTA